ncbi:2,6-dichlorophenolindophenol oxidoreductase subunit beta domain protein [Mycobacterium kansasii]|uniref:2,6-dichlorophenolindophenol oxidoreductase subunit beta domain protein n=1 Tax=Mycobacterium kansasii TaxID=1768 RepID=A0A1V3XF59_MYCKA|nr:2,6-dichlorophenolindophenol oxidoreductase subunit beta domain protein [Mycobacterium kansasii]
MCTTRWRRRPPCRSRGQRRGRRPAHPGAAGCRDRRRIRPSHNKSRRGARRRAIRRARAEIAAILQSELFGELVAPVERVGARFVPSPAAAALEAQVYPSPARIVAAVQRTLTRTESHG